MLNKLNKKLENNFYNWLWIRSSSSTKQSKMVVIHAHFVTFFAKLTLKKDLISPVQQYCRFVRFNSSFELLCNHQINLTENQIDHSRKTIFKNHNFKILRKDKEWTYYNWCFVWCWYSHLWFGFEFQKISPKNIKFSIFFPSDQKG